MSHSLKGAELEVTLVTELFPVAKILELFPKSYNWPNAFGITPRKMSQFHSFTLSRYIRSINPFLQAYRDCVGFFSFLNL